jgi:5,6-dimethylbenzimidazole synthase
MLPTEPRLKRGRYCNPIASPIKGPETNRFSDSERKGLYRAIRERRDVRSQFLPDPIPPEVLVRLLQAAHYAPSVGFMQPWDFILIESPMNLCITCDRSRGGPHVLGRNTILETDLFSVCLAVQNLWLAARAEGIGVGWVSILDQGQLIDTLRLPPEVYPVAYLCLGYVSEFPSRPELEIEGWRSRLPLHELVHGNVWDQPLGNGPLAAALHGEERQTPI